MSIEWVSDIVVRGSRMKTNELSETIEQLYANPSKWAKWHEPVNSHSWKRVIEAKYDGIEVVLTGGNNLKKNHPDKKFWTMYLRYNPKYKTDKGENIETK